MIKSSWLKKGVCLGLVFFLAILLVKPIGVSTQFSVLSGIIHRALDNSIITEDPTSEHGYQSTNAYYDRSDGKLAKAIENPWNYEFIFVISIALGGYIAYISSQKKRRSRMSDVGDSSDDPPTKFRNLIPSFLGGFILLYGARMADGCTSGHMMSGMMQGSISGYLFAASVFAVAIPTAILVGRMHRKRG